MLRLAVVLAGVVASSSAFAEPLNPDEARRFVVGKVFAFNCFEGTRGAGRIHADGSVAGSVQFQGAGPTRRVVLPPNTVLVRGEAVCGQVKGMPFSPCFNLERTSANSFRGSLSGFGFAYCDFVRHENRRRMITTAAAGQPVALRSSVATVGEGSN